MKVGDKMECLSEEGNRGAKIVGKLYTVINHCKDGDLGYIDENGDKAWFVKTNGWTLHPKAKTIDLQGVYNA